MTSKRRKHGDYVALAKGQTEITKRKAVSSERFHKTSSASEWSPKASARSDEIAARLPEIQEILGYHFKDTSLLVGALVHSSVATKKRGNNFDRLEFVGDRVLNLIISELLYTNFKKENEGELGRRYTALVCFETCANIAKRLRIQDFLVATSLTGSNNLRVLCDAMEAILGAMYIDGGLQPCQLFVKNNWGELIHSSPSRDSKTLLQEIVQERWKTLPVYKVISKEGSEHLPEYKILLTVEGLSEVVGTGSSRRTAEKAAAQILIDRLRILYGKKLSGNYSLN
jgi:ribonuclease-3